MSVALARATVEAPDYQEAVEFLRAELKVLRRRLTTIQKVVGA